MVALLSALKRLQKAPAVQDLLNPQVVVVWLFLRKSEQCNGSLISNFKGSLESYLTRSNRVLNTLFYQIGVNFNETGFHKL